MSQKKQHKSGKGNNKSAPKNASKIKKTATKVIWPDVSSTKDVLAKKIFIGISIFALLVMLFVSTQTGINGDDKYQIKYAENLVNYYATFGADTTALMPVKIGSSEAPMQNYGGFYEIIAGSVDRMLGLTAIDPGYHEIRHLFIAFFGFLAIFFTGLLAKELAGWRAGILAFAFLFLSPRFFGHAMMNPKDIPYAAGFAMALYFLVKMLKTMPKPNWKHVLGFGLGMGIALGTRAGGLLLIAYAIFFAGIDFVSRYGLGNIFKETKIVGKYLLYLGAACISGYIIGILFWPAALQSPLSFPYKALTEFSDLGTRIRLLFEGSNVMSDQTPWYYAPLWVFKTIPLFTLIGMLGSILLLPRLLKKYATVGVLLVGFAAIFPLFYVVYKGSTLHDGWRHLTFIYPAMVVCAVLFWMSIEQFLMKNEVGKKVLYGILVLLIAIPTVFIARNSLYAYTYFNPIGGGISGAFGNYETDYWAVSIKQAIDWMEDEGILNDNMEEEIVIATTFDYNIAWQLKPAFKKKVKVRYVRYNQRYNVKWDYAILPSRFYRGTQLRAGHWPNSKSIHVVKANNTPLTVIEKEENHYAYDGEMALKSKNFQEAIIKFKAEVEKYPDNELAWLGLQSAAINAGDFDTGISAGKKALELAPKNENGIMFLGLAYLNKGDAANAALSFSENIKINPKNSGAHYYLALVYDRQNKLPEALSAALKAIKTNPRFKAAYTLAASIYQKQGDAQNAQRYSNAAAQL